MQKQEEVTALLEEEAVRTHENLSRRNSLTNFLRSSTNLEVFKSKTEVTVKKPPPASTAVNVRGVDVPEKLIKLNEEEFMRKYKFDKAQYHQCIPNPEKENEFITVQIGRPNMRLADSTVPLSDIGGDDENASQKYQHCTMMIDPMKLIQ